MAKPINLKSLSENERGVLVEAIPLLRLKGSYYWEDEEFKRLYKKWLTTTDSAYSEGGFEQFRLAIAQMRKTMPNTYKVTSDKFYQKDDGFYVRKDITNKNKKREV